MKITVLGAGSWGTTVASVTAARYETVLWARDQQVVDSIEVERENSRYLKGFTQQPISRRPSPWPTC
jgi:glycerol-3-phosphate dehydrogenase (NAD(P)+)